MGSLRQKCFCITFAESNKGINALICRIEIHATEKIDGKKHVAVDIYFTGVGLFTIPNEDDLEAIISEMTQKTA